MNLKELRKIASIIDWSLTAPELAKLYGGFPHTYSFLRRELGLPKPSWKGRLTFAQQQYALLDWSLRDSDLAEITHTTRENIRQMRKILKKPRSLWHKLGRLRRLNAESIIALIKAHPSWTLHQVGANFQCSVNSIRQRLQAAHFNFRQFKFESYWPLLNLNLPVVTLRRIWGENSTQIYDYMQSRGIKPATLQDFKDYPEILASLIEVEKAKSVRYYA